MRFEEIFVLQKERKSNTCHTHTTPPPPLQFFPSPLFCGKKPCPQGAWGMAGAVFMRIYAYGMPYIEKRLS
jgi:hypothetical protein